LKKIDDQQLETFLRRGNKDVLVYLYEKNYKLAKDFVIKHGGSEGDVDGVLKDAIELLWEYFQDHAIKSRGTLTELITSYINEAWQKGEAKRYISRNTRIKHYYLRMYNRKTAGILVFLFICISIPLGWIYIENYFTENKPITAAMDSLKEEEVSSKPSKTNNGNIRKGQNITTQETPKDSLASKQDSLSLANLENTTEDANNAKIADAKQEKSDGEQNLVIKKDQILFSKTFSISDRNKDNGTTSNASKELVEKLNPEAHLPEESKSAKNMLIEFWKSPVNYKGYKLSRNKIILFGIENSDYIKLISMDENMYMALGSDYFQLEMNQDFKPLLKIRDAYLIAQLNKL